MASVGGELQISLKKLPVSKDRDCKLKQARERQNEERQKKIDELKAQAESAQRYREQKEEERRRRIDEIRNRDYEKRQQVEERKKAITAAEKERREYILKKNQERDSKLDTRKRERNSIVFAFGSSTPRLLEPADFGTVSPSSFWGHRRSTSITNVAGAVLSRRSSERELTERATSASATNRHEDDNIDSTQIIFRSVARRKTDLMPTIPSPRDAHYSSRYSLSTTPRTPGRAYSMNRLDQLAQPIRRNGEHIRAILERERHIELLAGTETCGKRGVSQSKKYSSSDHRATDLMSRSMTNLTNNHRTKYSLGGGISSSFRPQGSAKNDHSSRSGNVTPVGSIGSSRPGSAMSTSTTMSTSGFVARRAVPAKRKPRPASIAGTGVSLMEINNLKKENKPPVKTSNPLMKAQSTPKRKSNMMTTSSTASSSSRPSSSEIITLAKSTLRYSGSSVRDSSLSKNCPKNLEDQAPIKSDESSNVELEEIHIQTPVQGNEKISDNIENELPHSSAENVTEENIPPAGEKDDEGTCVAVNELLGPSKNGLEVREAFLNASAEASDSMTASMIARHKISTEEEAKAALAERRRLAREEAERQAELERQRLVAETLAELERQEEEAEQQRKFEEEAIRLAKEQREAEELRLRNAIEEARQREEEEQLKRQEEEKQRVEREEAEKKAKEDAEIQRLEVAERLRKEEKEREERRKRVEAIMSRTRKGGPVTSNSTPIKGSNEFSKIALASEHTNMDGSTNSVQIPVEQQHSQKLYEEPAIVKEAELINRVSSVNLSNLQVHLQPQISTAHSDKSDELIEDIPKTKNSATEITAANGNTHLENNKNNINMLQDEMILETNQLIDLGIDLQDNNNPNLNNNNSLFPVTTLVTAENYQKNGASLL